MVPGPDTEDGATALSAHPRRRAARLYWQGYTVREIATRLNVPYGTVNTWKRRDAWDAASVARKVGSCTEARLSQLVLKPEKTDRDLKEMDALGKLMERTARIGRFEAGGKPATLNPKLSRKPAKPGAKNALSEAQVQDLIDAFETGLFDYQKRWAAAKTHRIRNILKSRQIGATWYFAREALIDAVTTGDNQIFLSASRAQAHVFKGYILDFVKEVTGVELKGDPIRLWNGATLYFLGTNSRTAQSYHGHLYFDEYFWVHKFQTLRKVASGMAMHKRWRQTYFSTPSTLDHDAHPFWSGKLFNKGRAKRDRVEIDTSHAALRDGAKCADGQWRQIVTVEDAQAGGCDLFDIEALRGEYSTAEYRNLLMCEFIDAAASIFSLRQLQACMVDSWSVWRDFAPFAARPVGDQAVWIGYDPSRSRDNASVVVVVPPSVPGGLFRVIEKQSWTNISFEEQARRLRALTEKYNVAAINIDASGMGLGVYELVRKFFPRTRKIVYSVETKTRLAVKAMHLIQNRKIHWDAGWSDMVASLLSIHRSQTENSRHITYSAGRSGETGHADIAWALFNALDTMAIDSVDAVGGTKKGRIIWPKEA
ncbi:MAG: terminase family protein [Litorimonas sp.]